MTSSTNRGGKLHLYCFATMALREWLLLDTIPLHSYSTDNQGFPHHPSEFMTCRRQHGCNRRPEKYHEAGSGNIKATIYMHGLETVVYFCKLIPMRDILVHLHFSLQVIWTKKRLSDLLLASRYAVVDSDLRQYRAVLCALSLPRKHCLAKRVQ